MRKIVDPLNWLVANTKVSHELSRLIAAIPDIESPEEINRIFHELIYPARRDLPLAAKPLIIASLLSDKLLARALKSGSNLFAGHFIAGNGEEEIVKACAKNRKKGYLFNIDILGEAVCSEREAHGYLEAYMKLISVLAEHFTGEELSFSAKLSAFYSQINPAAPEQTAEVIAERIKPIADTLRKNGGHLYLDAEEYEFLETYRQAFTKLYKVYGNTVRFVLQTYLKNSVEVLDSLIELSDPKSPLTLRLVRGAYWDHESYWAEKLGWIAPPVFTEKRDTDRNFEELLRRGLRSNLAVIPGTHNAHSINFAASEERFGIKEFQVLKGMGETFAEVIKEKGFNVRFYMPVLFPRGDLSSAIAYLVRRIVENKSQTSFLAMHKGEKLKEALSILKDMREKRAPKLEEVL